LTAETVVGSLEDAEDYKAFEVAIISDYCAETAVARELVLRLASMSFARAIRADAFEHARDGTGPGFGERIVEEHQPDGLYHSTDELSDTTRQVTYCFLRLVNLDSGVFERLNRYEGALWRQTV
jgi:hypothetical protein